MTIRELYNAFDARYPRSLSCDWDRDGLMVCPCPEDEVKKVLCTLDVTDAVVERAIREGCNVIAAHHPLLFNPISYITPDDMIAARVLKCIRHGIAIMCFHTRADAAEGGVNDLIAEALGLTDVEIVDPDNIVRVGYLPAPMDGPSFAKLVKEAFHAPFVNLADTGKPIQKVAFCGGGGGSMLGIARASGADAYVTGAIDYHTLVDGPEGSCSIVEAGHWYTEIAIAGAFCRLVESLGHEAIFDNIHGISAY